MEPNAQVSTKLSTRARTLSQRRKAKAGSGERERGGVDLAHQDAPLKGDRDSWVNAGEHQAEYEDEDEDEAAPAEAERGREAAAA